MRLEGPEAYETSTHSHTGEVVLVRRVDVPVLCERNVSREPVSNPFVPYGAHRSAVALEKRGKLLQSIEPAHVREEPTKRRVGPSQMRHGRHGMPRERPIESSTAARRIVAQ